MFIFLNERMFAEDRAATRRNFCRVSIRPGPVRCYVERQSGARPGDPAESLKEMNRCA